MKKTILALGMAVALFASFAFTTIISYSVNVGESTVTWVGKKVTGSHNGTIEMTTGDLDISAGKLVGGNFSIDMTTIENSDIEDEGMRAKLEGHLKSADFFNVTEFPSADFVITSAKQQSGEFNYEITGDLTIKGQTHPVTFHAKVTVSGSAVSATASIVFDRSKYDVRYGSDSFFDNLGDKAIYDDVELDVNIVANK